MTIPIPAGLPPTASQTTAEHPWPLRLLNAKIKEYVDKMVPMWVEGEVSEFTRRGNARVQFFTLHDREENVTITCKAWQNTVPDDLKVGDHLVLRIKPDFWTGNGTLSLMAAEIRHVGIGDLLARLEELRNKLRSEGLFDASNKKPLPFLPRRIGLICGSNAKAKDDVIVNASARWPEVDFEIREVKVQGAESAGQVTAALAELDSIGDIDVIVIARGGGSVEDLLPFSDEGLVRAVAAATTPIVTAIGHETDRPLIDDAADYRASTPTDAAKRIVPDVLEEKTIVRDTLRRGRLAVDRRMSLAQNELDSIRTRPALANPTQLVEMHWEIVERLSTRLSELSKLTIERGDHTIAALAAQLRSLSPQAILQRGYAVLRTRDSVIRSASEVEAGDRLEAMLASGRLGLEVIATKEDQ